jgi:pentatricopeptide repeat protein
LISVEDGFHLWSDRYDRKLEDVFEVQEDIAANVVTALKGIFTLDEKEKIRRPETSIEAYDNFLKGRQHINQLNFPEAKLAFEKAIEKDSSYAPAYAGLANVYSWLYEWLGHKESDLKAAEKYSKRALELAGNLSESHTARAFVLTLGGNYQAAGDEFRKAIKIDPNSYDAHYLFARMCFSRGEMERAAELFLKASEIRRDDVQSLSLLAMTHRVLGRQKDSIEITYQTIARAERQLELDPTDRRVLSLGAIDLFNIGQIEKGFEWQEKVLQLYPEEPSVLINASCFYARAGMHEKAIDFLEKMLGKGFGSRGWIEHDPDYDSLRNNPRFIKLLENLSK